MALRSIDRRAVVKAVTGLIFTVASLRTSYGQSLAGKTIRLVYPFAAGNAGDALARILGDQLSRILSATVIIENRTGAAGRIGTQSVVKAEPDGTTMLLAPLPLIAIYPHSYLNLGYDPLSDLKPVSQIASFEITIAVGPKTGIRTIAELVDWIRNNPTQANYGSSGTGGIAHLFAVMFAQAANLQMTHVSYRGSAPAMNDVVAGQIPFVSVGAGDCIEMHKAGIVRMLAVSGRQRLALVPDVPTFSESGVPIDGGAWYGLYVQSKTPDTIVEYLSAAAREAVAGPSIKERLAALALAATGTTPAALAQIQRASSELWGPVVAASGLKPEL